MIIKATNFLKLAFVVALREAFAHTTTPSDYRYLANENDPNCKLRIYRAFPKRQFNPPALIINAEAADARFRYLDDEFVSNIYRVTDEQVNNDALSVVPVMRIAGVRDQLQQTYEEGTNFTYDCTTNQFTWITSKPDPYWCTYDTRTYRDRISTPIQARKVQSQIVVPIKISVYAFSTTDRERLTDLVVLYVRSVFREKFKDFCTFANIQVGGEQQDDWDNNPLYINTITVDCWTQYASEIDQSLYELINNIDITIAVRTASAEVV